MKDEDSAKCQVGLTPPRNIYIVATSAKKSSNWPNASKHALLFSPI